MPIHILRDGSEVNTDLCCPYFNLRRHTMARWEQFSTAMTEPDGGPYPGLGNATGVCQWCAATVEQTPVAVLERISERAAIQQLADERYAADMARLQTKRETALV